MLSSLRILKNFRDNLLPRGQTCGELGATPHSFAVLDVDYFLFLWWLHPYILLKNQLSHRPSPGADEVSAPRAGG